MILLGSFNEVDQKIKKEVPAFESHPFLSLVSEIFYRELESQNWDSMNLILQFGKLFIIWTRICVTLVMLKQ